MEEFSDYASAIAYAVRGHEGQYRKVSKVAYVVHPLRVTAILRAAGFSEFAHKHLMIAALFHDLVEDTPTTLQDIEREAGKEVAAIVAEVTKPSREGKNEWLENFHQASREAQILKMADRIDNLRDMGSWPVNRQRSYASQAKIILRTCGGAHPGLAQRLQEEIGKILQEETR